MTHSSTRAARSALALPVAAALTSLHGCAAEDSARRSYVEVLVRSSLTPGSELQYVSVALLAESGDDPVRESWFAISPNCQRDDVDGTAALFSLDVTAGAMATARLRVRGYAADDIGAPTLGIQRSLEIDFPSQPGIVVVELEATCRSDRIQCLDGETCDPQTGACSPVERLRSLAPKAEAPRVLGCAEVITRPAGILDTPTRCATGDETCPAGCRADQDRDCRSGPGASCKRDDECRTDLVCADGVCCNTACADGCSSCTLTGMLGTCSPIDYTTSDDVEHCGGCDVKCSAENADEVSCIRGTCAPVCNGDGDDARAFGDCDRERDIPNGCETRIDNDPDNCGSCDYRCADHTGFPYCNHLRCADGLHGNGLAPGLVSTNYYPLPAALAVGTVVKLNSGTVYGLGTFIDPPDRSHPGDVVLALAKIDGQGYPVEVVAQTDPLAVLAASDLEPNGRPSLTHGAVDPVRVADAYYWVLMAASEAIHIRVAQGDDQYLFERLAPPLPALTFRGATIDGQASDSLQPPLAAIVAMIAD
jgi:hypothetical protein